MNRLLVALLALSLSVTVLPACDEGEAEGDDEGTEQEQEQQEEQEETEETEQAQQAGDESMAAEFAGVMTQIMGFMTEASAFQCACAPEMMGFESTEECNAATGEDQDEALETFEACATEALTGAGEAPAAAAASVECARNAANEVETCFEELHSEHDDLCTEEGTAAFEACMGHIETGMDECIEVDDEEVEAWMEAADEEMNACMGALMGM